MLCRERDIHHEDAVAAVAEDRLKKVSEYHRQDRRRLARRDVLIPEHVSTEVMLTMCDYCISGCQEREPGMLHRVTHAGSLEPATTESDGAHGILPTRT